jgi:hypothetical protein
MLGALQKTLRGGDQAQSAGRCLDESLAPMAKLFAIDAEARDEKMDHAARHALRMHEAKTPCSIFPNRDSAPGDSNPCIREMRFPDTTVIIPCSVYIEKASSIDVSNISSMGPRANERK